MTKVTQLNVGEGGAGRRRIHLREISGDSESPLETVGQDLRAARLRRGEDLATVSRALKIRKDHLEAVEEDDLTRLPGKTYAIGFVRSYAGYLGLEATQMVERFKLEIAGRQDAHSLTTPMEDYERRKLPFGWRILLGVVVVLLAYGAWHLLAAGPTPQPVPPPPQAVAVRPVPKPVPAPPPVPQQTATVTPAASPTAPVPATAPPTAAAGNGAPGNVAAASTSGSATPVAAPPVPAVTPANPGRVYGAKNKNSRVVLRARADTHVEVRGTDGTLWISRNLAAGDQYNVPNLVGLTLSASNASAVELNLDGKSMGQVGADTNPAASVALDPQAIVDRRNNR